MAASDRVVHVRMVFPCHSQSADCFCLYLLAWSEKSLPNKSGRLQEQKSTKVISQFPLHRFRRHGLSFAKLAIPFEDVTLRHHPFQLPEVRATYHWNKRPAVHIPQRCL